MSDDIRLKLAKVLHEAWCVEPFDADKYPENFAMADAVLEAFPVLTQSVASVASGVEAQ